MLGLKLSFLCIKNESLVERVKYFAEEYVGDYKQIAEESLAGKYHYNYNKTFNHDVGVYEETMIEFGVGDPVINDDAFEYPFEEFKVEYHPDYYYNLLCCFDRETSLESVKSYALDFVSASLEE
jgi:hypothetical protein